MATPEAGPLFPLRLYIYRADGFHTGCEWIENEAALNAARERIMAAIREGLEVRITDPGDLMVKWWKDGKEVLP